MNHKEDLLVLAKEKFNIRKGMSTPIMSDLLKTKRGPCYNLRNHNPFHIPAVNTVLNGTESISFLRPKIWNLFPSDPKRIDGLKNFKESIKIDS